jgi:hypothetical protein
MRQLMTGRGREARHVQQPKKIFAAVALFAAFSALALDGDTVRVETEGRAYRIHMAFDVPAGIEQVKSVLTDFAHPSRLSSAVIAREVLGQQDGVVRVRTEFRDCVLFFCKTMVLIHDVTVSRNEVRADVVPDGSDFRHGFLRWSILGTGDVDSHVVFEAVMEPDFFVPPLIGGFLVRKALVKQARATAENLVREAPREALAGTGEK